MTFDRLPDGAYLAWRYVDRRGHVDRAQVYWDDGRVDALEDGQREEIFRFSPTEVEAARRAVVESGLPGATDLPGGDVDDTASVTYWWRVGDRGGAVVNSRYPAEQPAEIERLEARLAALEEQAGVWPLLADE